MWNFPLSSPWITSLMSWLALPARFLAVHVYRPASLRWVEVTAKVPLAKMRIWAPSTTGLLSFCQVTSGWGCPSATHSRLTGWPSTAVYSTRGTLSTGGTGKDEVSKNTFVYKCSKKKKKQTSIRQERTQTLFSSHLWDQSLHYLEGLAWSCPQLHQHHSLPGTGRSPHRRVWHEKTSELHLRAQQACDL